MNALRAGGLEPGRDVGIGGTNEAAAFHRALTTVLDNPGKLGRMAAERLLRRIADPGMAPEYLTLEPKLVIRESCGGQRWQPAATADKHVRPTGAPSWPLSPW